MNKIILTILVQFTFLQFFPLMANNINKELKSFYFGLKERQLLLRHQVKVLSEIKENRVKINRSRRFIEYTTNRIPKMSISLESRKYIKYKLALLSRVLDVASTQQITSRSFIPLASAAVKTKMTSKKVGTGVKPRKKTMARPIVTNRKKIPRTVIKYERQKSSGIFSLTSLIFIFSSMTLFLLGFLIYKKRSIKKKVILKEKKNGSKLKVRKLQTSSNLAKIEYTFSYMNEMKDYFCICSKKGEVIWANNKFRELIRLKSTENALFENIFADLEMVGENSFEGSFKNELYSIQKSNYGKNGFIHIYSIRKFYEGPISNSTPAYIKSDSVDLRELVESSLDKMSHLFQVAGVTLNLDLSKGQNLKMDKVRINNILINLMHSVYLMVKDNSIESKDINIKYNFCVASKRNNIKIVIPNFSITPDKLKLRHIYSNKVSDSMANILKRNDLLLRPLQGRTFLSNNTSEAGQNFAEIKVSFFNEEKTVFENVA